MEFEFGRLFKKTNLSRTAVSKHLKTLIEVGFSKVRREGTKKCNERITR